ncbi:hypothetical protein GCM10010116_32830 [Microbispora rosea subsp. aerata]|nr:hypothetical protein [Microbispora rosea]GGO16262.1 hypothetical protein GCM10010116_32830 [Microbispora rosea subsp. aerata]GIH55886.1 hypothetical protein Mro02_28000 [Microbispora rosea subsp. aerata]GLJ83200.1 hypothetical protein GCM10017588_19270 [Microbispora rosea subsp. aerata]
MSAIYDHADGERIAVAESGDSVSIINRSGRVVVAKKDARRLAERILAAAGRVAVVLFPTALRKDTLSASSSSGRWRVRVSPKNGARVLVEVDEHGLGPDDAYELAAAVAVAARHIGDAEQADMRLTTRIREVIDAHQGLDAEKVAAAIVAEVLDGR